MPRFPCQCGCGETCTNMFAQGHDARHKSNLINRVMSYGDIDAADELESRGWTKFLDKARQVATPEHQKELARVRVEESTQRLSDLREAAAKVKAAGRGKDSGIDRIEVTSVNYQAILESSIEQIREWPPSRGDWEEGQEGIYVHEGIRHPCQIKKINGTQFTVQWMEQDPKTMKMFLLKEHRTIDVNILERVDAGS